MVQNWTKFGSKLHGFDPSIWWEIEWKFGAKSFESGWICFLYLFQFSLLVKMLKTNKKDTKNYYFYMGGILKTDQKATNNYDWDNKKRRRP